MSWYWVPEETAQMYESPTACWQQETFGELGINGNSSDTAQIRCYDFSRFWHSRASQNLSSSLDFNKPHGKSRVLQCGQGFGEAFQLLHNKLEGFTVDIWSKGKCWEHSWDCKTTIEEQAEKCYKQCLVYILLSTRSLCCIHASALRTWDTLRRPHVCLEENMHLWNMSGHLMITACAKTAIC